MVKKYIYKGLLFTKRNWPIPIAKSDYLTGSMLAYLYFG